MRNEAGKNSGRLIDRIQSMKGISKKGFNKSIDVNPDWLKLSTTGKEPNIISYRKPIERDEKQVADKKSKQKSGRQASARVKSNVRKLVTS